MSLANRAHRRVDVDLAPAAMPLAALSRRRGHPVPRTPRQRMAMAASISCTTRAGNGNIRASRRGIDVSQRAALVAASWTRPSDDGSGAPYGGRCRPLNCRHPTADLMARS